MQKEQRTKTKEERIRGEKQRLKKLYAEIPQKKQKLVLGLIERAAFMRIEAEDLEKDLQENGWAESFRQSEKVEAYDRARPQGQTYNSLVSNYQKIVKQLADLMPAKAEAETEDPFDSFLSEREDL